MEAEFWELFTHRLAGRTHQPISAEWNQIAEDVARRLAALDTPDAAGLLSALSERIVHRREEIRRITASAIDSTPRSEQPVDVGPQRRDDPSDVGAPPGAPKPVPVPPEILAEAIATINEAEIAEAIREIRAGRGRSFDDFIDELDDLVDAIDRSSTI